MISLQFDVMKGLGLKLRSMKTPTKSYSHTKQQIHHKVQERNNVLQRVKFDTIGTGIRGQPQWLDVQGSNRLNTQKHLL